MERIKKAGGFVSANRVDGQLAMSRAIGDWSYKSDANLTPTTQKVIAVPDVKVQHAEYGDSLLLCCDGIVEQMTNEDAASFIAKEMQDTPDDPGVVVSKLLDHSLDKGSKDNMTAMLICMKDGSGYEKKDEYLPGPYYPDNREFADAFKTDARRHGIDGAELDKLIQKASAVPKPQAKGPPSLFSMPFSSDNDTDSSSSSSSSSSAANGDPIEQIFNINKMQGPDKLKKLMEILKNSSSLPNDEDEDEDEQRSAAALPEQGQDGPASKKSTTEFEDDEEEDEEEDDQTDKKSSKNDDNNDDTTNSGQSNEDIENKTSKEGSSEGSPTASPTAERQAKKQAKKAEKNQAKKEAKKAKKQNKK